MFIGYARVSTNDQVLDLQMDALKKADCSRVFQDIESGAKVQRPGLRKAFKFARSGDTVVVWRLDRLGRSLKDLIEKISALHNRNIGFKSIQENIDTTTSGGKLVFHIFGALAEFERDLIRERTIAGLIAARARGRFGGRPKKLNAKQVKLLKALYQDKTNNINDIISTLNISKSTLYRYMSKQPVLQGNMAS